MKTESMFDDDVKFWLHRVLAEKTEQLRVIAEEISVLNHQAQNFDKMRPEVQDAVRKELDEHISCLGWKIDK